MVVQRMPVSCMCMGKSGQETVGCYTLCYLRVFVHVGVIVQIDEIVPQSLTKNQPSDCNQSEADKKGCEFDPGSFIDGLFNGSSGLFLGLFFFLFLFLLMLALKFFENP